MIYFTVLCGGLERRVQGFTIFSYNSVLILVCKPITREEEEASYVWVYVGVYVVVGVWVDCDCRD